MSRIDYSLQWLDDEAAGRAAIRGLLLEAVEQLGQPALDIVEVGCGTAANLVALAGRHHVIGLEGLPDAVHSARAAGIDCRLCNLELAPWPLPDASVDALVALDVLEHLRHPELALAEARRVLRPGGCVIVNVPNHFDWRGRMRILQGSGIDSQRYFPAVPAWRYPHLRFMRHAELLQLLSLSGFPRIDDWSRWQCSLPKMRLLSRIGLGRPLRGLASRRPDLLVSGFFVIARRST